MNIYLVLKYCRHDENDVETIRNYVNVGVKVNFYLVLKYCRHDENDVEVIYKLALEKKTLDWRGKLKYNILVFP